MSISAVPARDYPDPGEIPSDWPRKASGRRFWNATANGWRAKSPPAGSAKPPWPNCTANAWVASASPASATATSWPRPPTGPGGNCIPSRKTRRIGRTSRRRLPGRAGKHFSQKLKNRAFLTLRFPHPRLPNRLKAALKSDPAPTSSPRTAPPSSTPSTAWASWARAWPWRYGTAIRPATTPTAPPAARAKFDPAGCISGATWPPGPASPAGLSTSPPRTTGGSPAASNGLTRD